MLAEPSMRPIIATYWRRFKQPIDQKGEVSPFETCCCFKKFRPDGYPGCWEINKKTARVQISETLLAHCEEEGDAFIHRIVTCDETWVHHYTPETKRASKEWRGMGEECLVKAKTRLSAGKVMATVFWDFKGVLLVDFLHARRTVNVAYYCNLLEKVRAAYRSKRRGFPIRDVLLLHDNARPHSAALTQEKLAEMYWTVLEHPPYSPNLSPCDYHMFGPLKEALGGATFRRWWWAGQELCVQVATDTSSFILWCRNKKTPNPLAKMHRERWKLCRKVGII